ncbi:MAG: diaminopimelate epimerase [Actinobacteria bacterium]|nr:diaminopimelate epimerase [Actinomycetota bacterium]
MSSIKFVKMHGQGNDFVIIDALNDDIILSSEVISCICDRHFGIGADGLIFIRKSASADFFMDYYNQDGTTAEMCGNGIRCMAGYIITHNYSLKDNFTIDTRAGIKNISVFENNNTGKKDLKNISIKVDMGKPVFEPGKIPVNIENPDMNSTAAAKAGTGASEQVKNTPLKVYSWPLEACGNLFKINCVSMGNPHCVIFLDDNTELNSIPLKKWGSAIENHPLFPAKTNVEFIKITGGQVYMRVWERGVGETLACGTGACASAVCTISLGKTASNDVKVFLPGGMLSVLWDGNESPVFLEGCVKTVFEGIYYINQ